MTAVAVRRLDDYQSWAFRVGATRIVVDPWLTDTYRLPLGVLTRTHGTEPACRPDTLPRPDVLLITAHFEDHLDPDTLRAVDRDVPVLTTATAAPRLRRLGFTDVRAIEPGTTVDVGEARLTAVRPGFPYRTSSLGWWIRHGERGGVYLETHVIDPASVTGLPDDLDLVVLPAQSVHLLGVRFAMDVPEALAALAGLKPRHVALTGRDPQAGTGPLSWLLRCRGHVDDLARALPADGPTEALDLPQGTWVTLTA